MRKQITFISAGVGLYVIKEEVSQRRQKRVTGQTLPKHNVGFVVLKSRWGDFSFFIIEKTS